MDTDRLFVWFVYASLAVAIVLMAVTVLSPSDGPTEDGPDVTDGNDTGPGGPTTVDGDDGPDTEDTDGGPDTEDTDGGPDTDDGNVTGGGAAPDDGGNGTAVQNDTAIQNDTDDPASIPVSGDGTGNTTGNVSGNASDGNATATPSGTREPADVEEVEDVVIQRINGLYEDAREPLLERGGEDLWVLVESHTADMIERDFFSHENPDDDDTRDRYQDADPDCQKIENYRFAFEGIAQTEYSAWTNDSRHKTEEEVAVALLGNYSERRDVLVDNDFGDIAVDVQYDGPRQRMVSTLAIC